MICKDFQVLKLSQLGFGTMRLPLREDRSIDEEQAAAMTAEAIAKGVNYFDTAWPYHGGKSETVIGEILKQYPRESFYLADKFPGHQIAPSYDVKAVFEHQLEKCGVGYFDFYLLHNVYENSIAVYEDERWGILPYLLEQKKNGRIRHLGFSTHAGVPALEAFLEKHTDEMEFCQIELNYLDWTLQQAKEKCELLNRYNIPIWVMEPVRGGKLANLPAAAQEKLRALRPDASDASWALRWVQEIPGVTWVKQEVPPGPQGITEVVQACGAGLVGVMSGFGAQYSPTDIARGVTATIHACEVCDVVQRVWDLFDAGKEDEGRALHYAILPALQLESLMGMLFAKEVMVRRGVFERKHVRLRTRTRPLHSLDLQEIDRVWERTRSLLKF